MPSFVVIELKMSVFHLEPNMEHFPIPDNLWPNHLAQSYPGALVWSARPGKQVPVLTDIGLTQKTST